MSKGKQEVIDEGMSLDVKIALEIAEGMEELANENNFTTDKLLHDAAIARLRQEGSKFAVRSRPLGELCRALRKRGFYVLDTKGGNKVTKVAGFSEKFVDRLHRPVGKASVYAYTSLSALISTGAKLLDPNGKMVSKGTYLTALKYITLP